MPCAPAAAPLGAIALAEQPVAVTADDEAARVLSAGIAKAGLDRPALDQGADPWRDRVMFLRVRGTRGVARLSDSGLAARSADCCPPASRAGHARNHHPMSLAAPWRSCLPYVAPPASIAEEPTHFEAPSGSRIPIDV